MRFCEDFFDYELIDAVIAFGRFKGRRLPEVDGVDGLDVIVAVKQDSAFRRFARTFGKDQGREVSLGVNQFGREAEFGQEIDNPRGARHAVGGSGGVCANGGKA